MGKHPERLAMRMGNALQRSLPHVRQQVAVGLRLSASDVGHVGGYQETRRSSAKTSIASSVGRR